jgi:hypothetical protein
LTVESYVHGRNESETTQSGCCSSSSFSSGSCNNFVAIQKVVKISGEGIESIFSHLFGKPAFEDGNSMIWI